jgi:hypothetical protein
MSATNSSSHVSPSPVYPSALVVVNKGVQPLSPTIQVQDILYAYSQTPQADKDVLIDILKAKAAEDEVGLLVVLTQREVDQRIASCGGREPGRKIRCSCN